MPNFTVISVAKRGREPEIKGSKFYAYALRFDEYENDVEMLQKPETPAPKVGETLDGTIEPGKVKEDGTKWPDKFKKAKAESTFRPRDPRETAAIVRQHSQEMAIRVIAAGLSKDIFPSIKDELKSWTDWFDADVASVRDVPSKATTEPPKTIRPAVPTIPLDRAKKILDAAQKAGLANGPSLQPALAAKLTEVGVKTGKLGHLSVDQAEDVEAFITQELATKAMETA